MLRHVPRACPTSSASFDVSISAEGISSIYCCPPLPRPHPYLPVRPLLVMWSSSCSEITGRLLPCARPCMSSHAPPLRSAPCAPPHEPPMSRAPEPSCAQALAPAGTRPARTTHDQHLYAAPRTFTDARACELAGRSTQGAGRVSVRMVGWSLRGSLVAGVVGDSHSALWTHGAVGDARRGGARS